VGQIDSHPVGVESLVAPPRATPVAARAATARCV